MCPDLYHSKLQQAMGLSNGVCVATRDMFVENGTDCISIGSDSAMMATDEMELTSCVMSTVNGFESAHTTNHTDRRTSGVATVGSSMAGLQHTCCSSRTQLCTMSFQQVNSPAIMLVLLSMELRLYFVSDVHMKV